MRYDELMGWVLTYDEYIKAGFTPHQFKHDRNRGKIITTGRACKGKPSEIIYDKLPDNIKAIIQQKFVQLSDDYQRLMLEGKMKGMEMTETGIEATAKTIEINEPFIKAELEAYIEQNCHKYTTYYLTHCAISGKSVMGYSKICALASWIYDMVLRIRAQHPKTREQNRVMRSLRVNLLEVIEGMDLEVKIPMNDIRFAQWLDMIITRMNNLEPIQEIIGLKREGNKNTSKLSADQEKYISYLYIYGNGMTTEQIHDKVVEYGRMKGWWIKDGTYNPVCYGTVRNFILANQNQLSYGRQDPIKHYNNFTPQVLREYPKKINEAWGIDGTAHNENVFYRGKVKQFLYKILIFDYASFRNLATHVSIGVSETGDMLVETVKEAIRNSGYLPYIIQSDKGPGYEGLKVFCEEVGIKLIPAGVGRARAKQIEALIGHGDSLVDRFRKGWSGRNRTAQGQNSHPSDEYFKKGKGSARSAEMASLDIRTKIVEQWNNHIIEDYEGKPLNKTPMELWNEKDSQTPRLTPVELAKIAGTKHTIKLTNEGVAVQNNTERYIYFPQIDTEEQRIEAVEIFTKIPRGKNESSQVDIYILNYGDPAPVFKGNKYLGDWTLKERVPSFATFQKDTTAFNNIRALQKSFTESSKNLVKHVRENIAKNPDAELIEQIASTPLTGKIRYTGQYDKEERNASEIAEKDGQIIADPLEMIRQEFGQDIPTGFKRLVDPDSGEIHMIPINNL